MAIWTVSLFLGLFLATDCRALGVSQNAQSECPSEWSAYGLRCFKFFKTYLRWIDAEAECLKHGGNLASVHSAEEYAFLEDLITEGAGSTVKTWLGGHDGVEEGTWLWSDGSKMSFQNWNSNQPDNYKQEHCLEINYGGSEKWNDALCNVTRPFVCARN